MNKLDFYLKYSGKLPLPKYTVDFDLAKEWADNGIYVVVYNNAQSRKSSFLDNRRFCGINVINITKGTSKLLTKGGNILYIHYIPKSREHFVEIKDGRVLSTTKTVLSSKKRGSFTVDTRICKIGNGYIFETISNKDKDQVFHVLEELALIAAKTVDLKHCMVDVIWNDYQNKAYVLGVKEFKEGLEDVPDKNGGLHPDLTAQTFGYDSPTVNSSSPPPIPQDADYFLELEI